MMRNLMFLPERERFSSVSEDLLPLWPSQKGHIRPVPWFSTWGLEGFIFSRSEQGSSDP